ncbi:hypothetical protein JL720_15199 [Aureococcus anophagefferens]|nr:hypothetical protein JL720_15199 [Aureococcus anophagefferens]
MGRRRPKLNLGNKTVWLPTADIEDIIVVAHATEHIGVPLNGLKDVVIDRVAPVRGAVSSVAADKTGIGYATKKLAIDVMDWDIIKRLVGCADDGGAALTRVESSGESKSGLSVPAAS